MRMGRHDYPQSDDNDETMRKGLENRRMSVAVKQGIIGMEMNRI